MAARAEVHSPCFCICARSHSSFACLFFSSLRLAAGRNVVARSDACSRGAAHAAATPTRRTPRGVRRERRGGGGTHRPHRRSNVRRRRTRTVGGATGSSACRYGRRLTRRSLALSPPPLCSVSPSSLRTTSPAFSSAVQARFDPVQQSQQRVQHRRTSPRLSPPRRSRGRRQRSVRMPTSSSARVSQCMHETRL
jgi:hypothetical protein